MLKCLKKNHGAAWIDRAAIGEAIWRFWFIKNLWWD